MISQNKALTHWKWVDDMGWHKTPLPKALILVISEVGEAINECRSEQITSNFAEEVADIYLRLADYALSLKTNWSDINYVVAYSSGYFEVF